MRCVLCLGCYAVASILRCSHLNRALYSLLLRKLSVQIECALSLHYNLSGYGINPYIGGVMATAR
ncbi:hypothetical protein D8T53_21365, partial [Vibrio vulnificus]